MDSTSAKTAPPVATHATRPVQCDPVDADATSTLALRVLHGPGPEGLVRLGAAELRIGRVDDGGVGLTLPDPSVSRLHATVVHEGEDWFVVDCGSSNGVHLNLQRTARSRLGEGDVIRLGDSLLVVERVPPWEESSDDMGLAGRSAAVVELRTILRRVAPSNLAVLVSGPTGTGKELVARALHKESRRTGAFVAVNCAALPSTLTESVLFGHRKGAFTGASADQTGAFVDAHNGTLFLDEIGDMALDQQPKLLRALETREVVPLGASRPIPVDVRVVVATNTDMTAALADKRFRPDLYARLAGIVMATPPLAARRGDVLLLFRRFLDRERAARPMTTDFAESLCTYSWPLNVRELRQLAERLSVLHPTARVWERGMLDEGIRTPVRREEDESEDAEVGDDGPGLEAPPTREVLIELLERHGGNVSQVASEVHRSRKQVYRWMELLDVSRGTGRRS